MIRSFHLGPPLEGTSCGGEGTHWCKNGECVPVQPAKWGGWKAGMRKMLSKIFEQIVTLFAYKTKPYLQV